MDPLVFGIQPELQTMSSQILLTIFPLTCAVMVTKQNCTFPKLLGHVIHKFQSKNITSQRHYQIKCMKNFFEHTKLAELTIKRAKNHLMRIFFPVFSPMEDFLFSDLEQWFEQEQNDVQLMLAFTQEHLLLHFVWSFDLQPQTEKYLLSSACRCLQGNSLPSSSFQPYFVGSLGLQLQSIRLWSSLDKKT